MLQVGNGWADFLEIMYMVSSQGCAGLMSRESNLTRL